VHFNSLSISNLRAVKKFHVDNLGSFVAVAGQNGSGKSCVFDAIRLLKSTYGGYSANEYHQWFGEFAVNLQDKNSILKLFRNRDMPIMIKASVSFAESETLYMQERTEELVEPLAWLKVTGQPADYWTWNRAANALQLQYLQPQLNAASAELASNVKSALGQASYEIELEITISGELRIRDCPLISVAFQSYAPEHLGVIEYHSASRSYERQEVGGINLDTRAFEDQRRQHRLYNWQDKYRNVKTELASSYLRAMIARESGQPLPGEDLNDTLVELFQTFFPDKAYEGVRPKPGGSLEFPVRLRSGETHDIDDLSSGEKEILYGYLKLRNSAPKNSVILLDEPELHLNPSLLQGFADFYHRHLGAGRNNQLWVVTHSDTVLRQAVGNMNYRVYQMVVAHALDGRENQAVEVIADDDVEKATIDLIGDLAAYRPYSKVVVLEGKAENGFDVMVVRRLFPDFARRVNLISGGHKQRVRDLYSVLSRADVQAGTKSRFFATVDKDSESQMATDAGASEFSWDVYHIENYLLDAGSIRAATAVLGGADAFADDEEVIDVLRECASELVDGLVLERVRTYVNAEFIHAIKIAGRPNTKSPASDIAPFIQSSAARIRDIAGRLTTKELENLADQHRVALQGALVDGTWQQEFPGRAILKRYTHRMLKGKIEAALFANAVLDKMVERRVEPEGMARVLNAIRQR
jgi:energy-coupling factor transporter ATP-binding protein EcfA2